METNLANIYASLSQKFGNKYNISYTTPSTYLSKIVGDEVNTKVILVYLEDRSNFEINKYVSPSKLSIKQTKKTDEHNLTGSPLKDDCIVDSLEDLASDMKLVSLNPWKLEEEYHKGISVEKVHAFICTPEFQELGNCDENKNITAPIWFLCNSDDAEKTVFLQYEFSRSYFSRGLIIFNGILPADMINFPSMVRRHYDLINSNARIETYFENTYNIKCDIAVRCSWTTAAPFPSLIDLSTCDVILSQVFRLSHCSSLTQDFMNQLQILMFIREDILAYKAVENDNIAKEAVYRCGRGINMEELRESVNKAMTEISGFAELDASSGFEHDIETVIQRASIRRLTDLTDKLWEIIKCCSSYKDLKIAFNILFQCAARCNIVNTPTNKNRLAEMITEVANRRLAIPCLNGSEPLELLLEIGLEKLQKDYEYIFTESKMCSANILKYDKFVDDNKDKDNNNTNVRKSLRNAVRIENVLCRKTLLHNNLKANSNSGDDIIGFKNSNFDERESLFRITKLMQIHCTLEHLLQAQIHLNLKNSVCSDVCDQLLKKPPCAITTIDQSSTNEIEINLSPHDVRELLEGRDPQSRRITIKSKNKFRDVKSTFYYNMDNIFPTILSQGMQCEEKELVKENVYYSWLYQKIKTVK